MLPHILFFQMLVWPY